MPADSIDLTLRLFSQAWHIMCAGAADYAALEREDLECVFSGVPVAFFNIGLVKGRNLSAADLKGSAQAACAFAADQGAPWLLITTTETLATGVDAAAALDPVGLAPLMSLTGMVTDRIAPRADTPERLDLTVPQDEVSCGALLDVNAVAYAMDLEAAKTLIGRPSFWAGHFPVLGRVDGEAACTSAVLIVEGYRYVALVATDPAHQRKGYADAAMRRALEDAARVHGELPSFLHATDAGKPVYERMGYRTVSTHGAFIEKRFLEAH